MNHKYFLDEHLKIIEHSDTEAGRYWKSLSNKEQYISSLLNFCDDALRLKKDLAKSHHDINRKMSKMFIEVQEKPFEYSRIRTDWHRIVTSEYEKKMLFKSAESHLKTFLQEHNNFSARQYGGIKTERSIVRKLSQQSVGTSIQQNVLDLWDVVRFKVVVDDLASLLELTKIFWKENILDIVRCRNYYFNPRQNSLSDTYRAIHFELADKIGNIIEIQFTTYRKEVISSIDHPFSFKKLLMFVNDHHKQWLIDVSKVANIQDAEESLSKV